MFNILGDKGNPSQSNIEIPSYFSQNDNHQENKQEMLAIMRQEVPLICCGWECKFVHPLRKSVWRFLKKLKIELSHHPAIPPIHIYPKECKSAYNREMCTPMFTAARFTITKLWKQPTRPLPNERLKNVVYKEE
jgi:hypothetical protein